MYVQEIGRRVIWYSLSNFARENPICIMSNVNRFHRFPVDFSLMIILSGSITEDGNGDDDFQLQGFCIQKWTKIGLEIEFLILLLYVKLHCEIARLVKLARILMECTHNKQNHRVLGKCRKNRVKRANGEVSVKSICSRYLFTFWCLSV